MNVWHGWATDPREAWTTPFPSGAIGFKVRFLAGDLVSPDLRHGTLRPGHEGERKNYFNTIPASVRVEHAVGNKWWFFSLGIGRWGFYLGHKVFGLDSDAYKDWPGLDPEQVYPGSLAVTGITIRFTLNRPRASRS